MFSCQCNLHGFHLRLYFAIVSVKLYPTKVRFSHFRVRIDKSRGVNVGVIKRGGIIVCWHLSEFGLTFDKIN